MNYRFVIYVNVLILWLEHSLQSVSLLSLYSFAAISISTSGRNGLCVFLLTLKEAFAMRDLLPTLSFFFPADLLPRVSLVVGCSWRSCRQWRWLCLPSGQPRIIYTGRITELQITLSNSDLLAPISNVAFAGATTSNGMLSGTLPNGLKVAGAATYSCYDPSSGTRK